MKDDRINQKFARPNLFIKIPAAWQGLPAIAVCLAEGINVNITLIFSLARYDEVMDAFLDGLEGARQAGLDLASIASVASFFVSRVDTEVDARLDKIGTAVAAALRGRAAIANARLAYRHYEKMLASPRWAALASAGAQPRRPLWASTSVKDPAYPDTRYVTDLVASGVVNTMPEATLARSPITARHPGIQGAATTPAPGRSSATWPRSASTTTTSCRSWKTTAWPLLTPAGRSWATSWPPSSRGRLRERRAENEPTRTGDPDVRALFTPH
jgi:transaldolase